jgi:hypothetical protein
MGYRGKKCPEGAASMDKYDPIAVYTSLTPRNRLRALARLAHDLTIVAREYYVPGTMDLTDPAAVREINELQHRVAGQVRALLEDDPMRFPDDVIARIIMEESPGRPALRAAIRREFVRALDAVAVKRPEFDNVGS